MRPSRPVPLAIALALLALSVSPFVAPGAFAHDRASAGVDETANVVVAPTGVTVVVELWFGEHAAESLIRLLDGDGDGTVTDEERRAFDRERGEAVRAALQLTVAGTKTPLRADAVSTSFPLGPTGLTELKLRARFVAPWPAGLLETRPDEIVVELRDKYCAECAGHRKILVTGRPSGSVRYRIDRPEGGDAHRRPTGATIKYRPGK